MFKIVAGAICGVLIACLITLCHLPYIVLLIALPVAAFTAKYLQCTNIFYAQLSYTPFALINLFVLAWPPHQGIDVLRVEDILLGAAIAAGFSLLIFPHGLNRVLAKLVEKALAASGDFLHGAIAALHSHENAAPSARADVVASIRAYEDALDAAFMSSHASSADLVDHERALALSRDFLIGGDTCMELLALSVENPKLLPVGREISQWWQDFLSTSRNHVTAGSFST
jgi:uncharacterized membrane protein YccC